MDGRSIWLEGAGLVTEILSCSKVWLSAPCSKDLDCLGDSVLDYMVTLDNVSRHG